MRFVWFSYYKTANCTAPCSVMQCGVILLAVQCSYAILWVVLVWFCGLCCLCGLMNNLQFRQFDLNIPLSSRFYSYIVTKQMNSNEYYIIAFCITCNTYPHSYLIIIIVY